MNKYCNKCIVHCSLMSVNTLMKSYCIVLPYKCIGLQIGYVYLHRCMCHYINISPKSSSNTKFLTSEYFFPSLRPHQRHYVHRIYVFMNFQVIQFSYLGAQFFSVIWPKYHIINDSALRTSYLTVTREQMLLKNISLYKYSVSWVMKTLYLFNQQFFIYLQTANKLKCSKLHATLHSRERREE